jgi:predicted nucleic acid-binding protein
VLNRSAVVLDASAGVEMALLTELGATLAEHVEEADEVVVPDHFHLEAAAAIRRLELRGALDGAGARDAFGELLSLGVRRIDTWGLLVEAWELRHNVTVADALYVVLARRLDIALVTGDGRLARAPGLGVEVLGPPVAR